MRTLVIGDIHGCLRAFDSLLKEVEPRQDDLIVTLGDYVDRGPDVRGVLDRLVDLQAQTHLVSLNGNHDLMMLAARENQDRFNEWLCSGGKQTMDSYASKSNWDTFAGAIPARHWQFLKGDCLAYYETGTHIFVHANVSPDLPLAEQSEQMLYWEKLEVGGWRPHKSGKTMICGHSAQRSGRPLVLDRAVCIDTWAYGGGWLTCLDVDIEVYWQANQRGETRVGNLGFRSRSCR